MRRTLIPAFIILAAVVSGCAGQQNSAVSKEPAAWQTGAGGHGGGHNANSGQGTPLYTSEVKDAQGKKVAEVAVAKKEHGMTVTITASHLKPGFHATHLHAVGKCEPASPDPADAAKTGDFLSAGGHLAGEGKEHPQHAGDLPMLYVAKDGTGHLATDTDRLTEKLLDQQAGVSLVVHAGADNYANIPTRYAATGADAETKKAGDSGGRVACGVLKKS